MKASSFFIPEQETAHVIGDDNTSGNDSDPGARPSGFRDAAPALSTCPASSFALRNEVDTTIYDSRLGIGDHCLRAHLPTVLLQKQRPRMMR